MFKRKMMTVVAALAFASPAVASSPSLLTSVSAPRQDVNAGGRTGTMAYSQGGSLYGTAEFGGDASLGEVYRLDPPSVAGQPWTRTTLFSFTAGMKGTYPIGGVVLGAGGVLYGVTAGNELGVAGIRLRDVEAGDQYGSVVYALTPQAGGYVYQQIADLGGFSASGGLVSDASGALYGTSQRAVAWSTGQVFRLAPTPGVAAGRNHAANWTFTSLYDFFGATNVTYPQGGVTVGADGSLYGVTTYGGDMKCHDNQGCGTVFRLRPSTTLPWTLEILHAFRGGHDGDRPRGPLLVDPSGNLLGVTTYGGHASNYCTEGCGTVFSLASNGQWRIVHKFCSSNDELRAGCSDGMAPAAGLVRARDGNFYGTASLGGSAERGGTVFRVDAFGTFSLVAALGTNLGGEPASPLIEVQTNLVGTTAGATGQQAGVYAVAH